MGAVSNHWHFSVRPVDLEPPGDLLFILNPESRHIQMEGPQSILMLSTAEAQATVIAPLLLKAFNGGMDVGSDSPKVAPWSWSTTSQELAKAVSARLQAMGVSKESTKVGVGKVEEERVANEEWERLMKGMQFMYMK